jgi:hypothetical protein
MRTVFAFERMQIFARARSRTQDLPALLTCREVLSMELRGSGQVRGRPRTHQIVCDDVLTPLAGTVRGTSG